MCMGYAKDIAAWACQGEVSRREAALLAWGETWLEQGVGQGDGQVDTRVDQVGQAPQSGQQQCSSLTLPGLMANLPA